jgi:DNA polymerase
VTSALAPHVTATMHPSAVLRRPTGEERRAELERLIEDMRRIARVLKRGR